MIKMKPVSDIILEKAIRHGVYLERLKNSEVRQLIKLFNEQIEPDILASIARKIGTGTITEKRLKALKKAIKTIVAKGYQRLEQDFTKQLRDIGVTEGQWNAAMLKKATPIEIDFTTPHLATLKAAASKSYVRGRLLKDWFADLDRQTVAKITQQINIGVANGESVYHITRRIRGTQAAGFTDGILRESRRNIESVVRTSISQVSNKASEDVYQSNADAVKSVQLVATLDSRTTEICMGYDGKVYKIGEGPRPPFHFGCRTRTIPVLKSWKELGINLKEAPIGTRASMNGQVSSKLTYGKWLKQQPNEMQDEILGTTRANLFRKGKVKIDQFARDGKLLTLEQLRAKEGLSVKDIKVKRRKPA